MTGRTLAELVTAHRQRAGLSMIKLSERAGLSQTYVSRIESGSRPHPSERAVGALADALALSRIDRYILHATAGRWPPTSLTVRDAVTLIATAEGFHR